MLQARLRTLSLTALTATLAALVMLIIKISPLKDIPFYFLLLCLQALVLRIFGIKTACEYYVVSSVLALLILQIPFCLSYICLVATWPFVKYFCETYILSRLHERKISLFFGLLVSKMFFISIYLGLTLVYLTMFVKIEPSALLARRLSLALPAAAYFSIFAVAFYVAALVVDCLLSRALLYFEVNWREKLQKYLHNK